MMNDYVITFARMRTKTIHSETRFELSVSFLATTHFPSPDPDTLPKALNILIGSRHAHTPSLMSAIIGTLSPSEKESLINSAFEGNSLPNRYLSS